ncbi:transglutaminase domain-containing protein [Stenotrophomonas sp.]|uniref:transglutaminase domain-containing protein n=1 Tax=Stenotrophomonas sp. TaxID=69392 RepID=UPI002D26D5CC|nr:transglutaminase domain-containing protein [Stenotrophomonas sp.]HYQ24071.1 transglutaminase domain-containing protein [Stenotrophomonas sp.]
MRRLAACCFASLLAAAGAWAAPAQDPPAPGPYRAPPTPVAVASVPAPGQVLAVPQPLRQMLRERVMARHSGRGQRLQALVEMIFGTQALDLQYDPLATYTLAEIWQTRRANCLAFTLLFATLAREAGIQARVQEVDRVVSWYQDQNQGVVYSVGHVNVGVLVDGRSGTVDLDRNILYDRRGPQPISLDRALAHFYNNRGAERMTVGDTVGARAFFNAALAQAPEFAPTWNNLGVLDSRQGDLAGARAALETSLRLDARGDSALTNASVLYRRLGLVAQAQALERRLKAVQRDDPFAQYMAGASAERSGDLATAIRYYRRAVQLYDSAHQFHFGLARAYFLSGQMARADHELMRARALGGSSNAQRYQAKLDGLARLRTQQARR